MPINVTTYTDKFGNSPYNTAHLVVKQVVINPNVPEALIRCAVYRSKADYDSGAEPMEKFEERVTGGDYTTNFAPTVGTAETYLGGGGKWAGSKV